MKPPSNDRQPLTKKDVPEVAGPVAIPDLEAPTFALPAFVQSSIGAAVGDPREQGAFSAQVQRLKANVRWSPRALDMPRGQSIMTGDFNRPSNLTPRKFAICAAKTQQQINADIEARVLLAISNGLTSRKLPDWQLDSVKSHLTQTVLAAASDVDDWTLYRTLSEPLEGLGARAPIEVVTADSVNEVAAAVLNALSIHTAAAQSTCQSTSALMRAIAP